MSASSLGQCRVYSNLLLGQDTLAGPLYSPGGDDYKERKTVFGIYIFFFSVFVIVE